MPRTPSTAGYARSDGLLFALVTNLTWAAQVLYWPLVDASGPVELPAATGVLTVAYGRLPWIAFTLCGLMAVYAGLKKSADAPAIEGFTAECLAMTPVAVGYIIVLLSAGRDTVVGSSLDHLVLVAASGLVTAIPLLAHTESLRRLRLTTVGVLQYINPTLQFLLGILLFHETMSPARWTGFVLAWVSVATFAASSWPGRGSEPAQATTQWRGRGRRPNSASTIP